MLGKIIGGAVGSFFGPVGTIVGVAVGHKLDASFKKNETDYSTTSNAASAFDEKLLRGPYFVKGGTFALSIYFPVTVEREVHNKDIFSRSISEMKFHYRYGKIPLFADSINWFIQKTEIQSEIDCIVTCPTSEIRAQQPLEMIASRVSELTSIPYYKVFTKNDQTAKQMGAEGRKEAARSIRLTDPTLIKGKRILLIDDIITSGSTMGASKEKILEGGAIDVLPLAVLTTADAYPPDKLELHPKSRDTNKPLSQRIKDSAVTLYRIYENGESRLVYYPEYKEYQKKQVQINEELRKKQEEKRREDELRKKEEAKKEAERRLELENQIRKQLSIALITGDKTVFSQLLKHGLRLNDNQDLVFALHSRRFEMVNEYIDHFPSELSNHEILYSCLEWDLPLEMIKSRIKSWHSNERRDTIIKAVNDGRTRVVMKMKDLDFNFNVRNNMGDSLYEIAKKKGHTELANFLRRNVR